MYKKEERVMNLKEKIFFCILMGLLIICGFDIGYAIHDRSSGAGICLVGMLALLTVGQPLCAEFLGSKFSKMMDALLFLAPLAFFISFLSAIILVRVMRP